MWLITKSFTFEAAHHLKNHDGKCARNHGHSWSMSITFKGLELQTNLIKNNMIVDYQDIKNLVQPMMEQFLDHWDLNITLDCDNPTSEFVARWIWDYIEFLISITDIEIFKQLELYQVEINETCTSGCIYRKYSSLT